ncbi:MAG: HEPN domain-containing protein [Planctomycetota bacterium]
MSELAEGFWERAQKALQVARSVLSLHPDTAASRAYYAAFYAVSAHFAGAGRTFKKHSALEAAVHRDLVKPGTWPRELGARYTMLIELRRTGDYGTLEHVSAEEASGANSGA